VSSEVDALVFFVLVGWRRHQSPHYGKPSRRHADRKSRSPVQADCHGDERRNGHPGYRDHLAGDFVPDGVQCSSPRRRMQDSASAAGPAPTRPARIRCSRCRCGGLYRNRQLGTSATINVHERAPTGVMGATYGDTLRITGGGGLTIWSGRRSIGRKASPRLDGVVSGSHARAQLHLYGSVFFVRHAE